MEDDLFKRVASLPTVTLSDGQNYIKMQDALKEIVMYDSLSVKREPIYWLDHAFTFHLGKHLFGIFTMKRHKWM